MKAEEIGILEQHIGENRTRVIRLLEALETGKLSVDDVSSRISELKAAIKTMELKRDRLMSIDQPNVPAVDMNQLKEYVADLRELLLKSEAIQRKSFLKSFIKRIRIAYPKVVIEYTIPVKAEDTGPSEEVLSIDSFLWGTGIRTPIKWSRATRPAVRRSPSKAY